VPTNAHLKISHHHRARPRRQLRDHLGEVRKSLQRVDGLHDAHETCAQNSDAFDNISATGRHTCRCAQSMLVVQ